MSFMYLLQHKCFVNSEKCLFHQHTITFLGYVISNQGVEMDLSKVQAMADWPNPSTTKELQHILGFNYFY